MAKAPFPVDPYLTGIALAYRNRSLIADAVLPRMQPYDRETFKYSKWTLAEGFTIPDTKVGRKSIPAEVEFNAAEVTDSTVDYGLDDLVPWNDQQNAAPSLDPEARAAEVLSDLVALDREKRVADLVFTLANYPSANRTTLSGTSQWSDTANSDPITAITTALDVPIMRPNVLVLGRATFTALSRHPKIVAAVNGGTTQAGAGIARRQQLADLFELEEVLVGESFLNTAKKGQTASLSRVWGKHASLIYRDRLSDGATGRVTFGWTAQFGTRIAMRMDEPKVGLRGSTRIRVGESVKEVIAANDVAYFFENAVA